MCGENTYIFFSRVIRPRKRQINTVSARHKRNPNTEFLDDKVEREPKHVSQEREKKKRKSLLDSNTASVTSGLGGMDGKFVGKGWERCRNFEF